MTDEDLPTIKQVQDAWRRAIEDWNEVESMDELVTWAVKYVPDPELRKRAKRYARFPALCRNRLLLESRLLDPLFEAFRAPYDDNFAANMGIAIAPNSQAFSFKKTLDGLMKSVQAKKDSA